MTKCAANRRALTDFDFLKSYFAEFFKTITSCFMLTYNNSTFSTLKELKPKTLAGSKVATGGRISTQ